MAVMYFVWLGSGRSRRRKVGLEGRLIDQAGHAGLPLPPGAILLDEFYRVCLEKGLVETFGNGIIIPDSQLLHNTLFHSVRLPRFERPIAVTSISSAEDSVSGLTDGIIHRFNTDAGQPDKLASALAAAWSSISARSDETRRDLLLIEEVAADHHGRAWLRESERGDRIEVYTGSEWNGPSLLLPVLHGWSAPDESLPPFARRLQMLLRGVRRTFGPGDWEIEWADDERVCRLLWILPQGSFQSSDGASP